MSPELVDNESEMLHRRRFRFSLRTAFVLVTIACIALGCFIAGYRRAAEIRARDIAVQNTILGNLSKAPPLLATRQTPPPGRILRMSDFGDVVPRTKGIIREGTNGGTIYHKGLTIL